MDCTNIKIYLFNIKNHLNYIVGKMTPIWKKYFKELNTCTFLLEILTFLICMIRRIFQYFSLIFCLVICSLFYLSQSCVWSAFAISYLYQIVWGTNQIFEVLLHDLEYFLLHCHYEADIIPGIHLAQVFCGFQRNTVIEYMRLCKKIFWEKVLRESTFHFWMFCSYSVVKECLE